MKDIRINGRLMRVFVLAENDTSIVYIPLKGIQRVDYERLLDMEKQGGEMMKVMARTKLSNGRNALSLYDNVIQVARFSANDKKSVRRLSKPDEGMPEQDQSMAPSAEYAERQPQQTEDQPQEPPKQRKKPGPAPGTKRGRKKSTEATSE